MSAPPPSGLRSAVAVSATRGVAAALSLVIGVLSARYFGTSFQKDAFLVAWTIPTMGSMFLIGGIYSNLLIGLADIGRVQGAQGQRAYAARIVGGLALVLAPLVALVLLAPGLLVQVLAPGFSGERFTLAASLLRLTVFAAIGSLFMAAVTCLYRVRGQFVVIALVTLLNPLACLATLVALVGTIGIYTLAVGPLVGVALTILIGVALVPRYIADPDGFVPAPADPAEERRQSRAFWMAFLPLSIGSNFGQINTTVDNFFASSLPIGSISMLAFAFVIMSNAQLLTTSTVAEVSFTRLAAHAGSGIHYLKDLLRSQIRHVLLLTAPLSVGALAFATPIVRLLFEHGEFTPEDTLGVATALRAYAPGMFLMAFLTQFSVFLTSQRRIARIATIAAAIIAVNALLDYVLMRALGLAGIALGTSLTILTHTLLLLHPVRRILGRLTAPGDGRYVVKVVSSALIMGGLVLAFALGFERLVDPATQEARIAEVLLGLALGAGVYVTSLHLFRVEEAKVLLRRLLGPIHGILARRRPAANA